MTKGKLIIYTADDGGASIQLRTKEGMVWLAQAQIADLFDKSIPHEHTKNIVNEGELSDSTIRKFRIVRNEGGRTVGRTAVYYNLDMICAVGYREWEEKLDAFLSFNEREILSNAGKVSQAVAERLAYERYEEFDDRRRGAERLPADREDVETLRKIKETMRNKKGNWKKIRGKK